MSLLDTPVWEVIKGSFAPDIWARLAPAILETLYMTALSSVIPQQKDYLGMAMLLPVLFWKAESLIMAMEIFRILKVHCGFYVIAKMKNAAFCKCFPKCRLLDGFEPYI